MGRVSRARASILLIISSNDELRDWIKNTASRAYGKFLMLRHIRYFLSYKDFEIVLRRIQQGEDVYSLYLASTARFESSFKWGWTPSVPISKILGINHGRAWTMELNLAVLMPFSFQLINEGHGLAVIGRDINNREIHWSFSGSSPPHVLIIGPTGAGKTTLAMSIAYQVKRRLGNKVKLIIIDPHGHTEVLGRLINVRTIDLSRNRIIVSDSSILIESVRLSNPLFAIGTEGALLRMVSIGDEISSIDELMRRLKELSSDLILKEAYYNLYNALAPIINYYNGVNNNALLNVYDLLNGDAIFTMRSILSNELLRYLTLLIILSISKKAISECPNPPCPLRYLVVIDEAHNVLKLPSEYRVLGVDDPVERMFRELRKFGVALFILVQPPLDALNEGVLGNIGTAIILSGNSQYVSHVVSNISGINGDDATWLLSGRFRALVLRQGEPKPIKLSRLHVPKELIMEKAIG